MKIKLFSTLLFMVMSGLIYGQEIEISGTITDESGEPLPGASAIIEGTSIGVESDFDGNFKLSVDSAVLAVNGGAGKFLVANYVGFTESRIEIGNQTTINFVLKEGFEALEEVVVTAQGIKKSKKALGYAIAKLDSEDIENRPEADVARTLQGKIAGVTIGASNGETGASTTIRIRSSLSITQSNYPLIVVNGVPFSGSLKDIDANDIKDMSVLKGLNASVLYGSEGRNGVILIQTKSGSSDIGTTKFKASASITSYINEVANLPDYQNKYGQGSDNVFAGGNVGTWGPSFDSLDEVPHPYSGLSHIFPEYKDMMVPYTAKPNNVQDFFNTGSGTIVSANVSTSQEKSAFNISAGYTDEQGIIGKNDMKRFNLGLGGQMQLSDKFNVNATLNYSSRQVNRLQAANIFDLLLYIPRNLDVYNLPYENPQTGASVYYRASQNPLWVMNNTGYFDDIDRVFATTKLKYDFTDKLSLNYRVGLDVTSVNEFDYSNKGGFGANEFGFLNLDYDKRVEVDQSLILGWNNVKVTDRIGLDAQIGLNSNYYSGKSHYSSSGNQIVFGYLNPENFLNTEADYTQYSENLAGAFGQFQFSLDNFLYVTLSGRNDWGSTVESENQSLFYPGASFSFIPTSAFDMRSDAMSYLKVRAAYGTSSGYPGRYLTRPVLDIDARRFVTPNGESLVTNSTSSRFPNPNLTPELHKEFEVGVEGRFWKNRINLEASIYKRISEDQILAAERAPSTGFSSTYINAGRIDTEGLEIDLGIDVIKKENFNWNLRNLFTAYETEVVDLPDGQVYLGSDRYAIEGQPFGVLQGSWALRDDQGNLLINPDNGELYISDEAPGLPDKIMGDPYNDWSISNINSVSYKNFTLSTQFEYRHGGLVFARAVEDLLERGVTKDTENRDGSFVLPGVYGDPATGLPLLDANGNTIPNTIQLNALRTTFSNYYNTDEFSTFDASIFRLREIALGYTLTKAEFKTLPFESLNFTLSGRNIWYKAQNFPDHLNYDPENDGGNGDQTVPTTKRFALSVAVTF